MAIPKPSWPPLDGQNAMHAPKMSEGSKRKIKQSDWVFYLLSLTVLIMLLGWACRWGWAEVLAVGPRMKIELWQQQKLQPTVQELAEVQEQLASAQSWNGMSADIAFERGLVAEWQALQTPVWSASTHDYRNQAIEYFKKALDLRPSWGMAWVHLANSLVLNRQLYSGAMNALEKASILAPLEKGVQQRIIWLGLSQWSHLNEEQRRQLHKIVEYAMRPRSNVAIKAIVDFRLEKEFTRLLSGVQDHKVLQRYLKKRERLDKARRNRQNTN